jgi:hypothetical protein
VRYPKLEAALHSFVEVTLAELDKIAPEIESAEVDLFASFGFPHKMTGLMDHLNEIKNRVSHPKTTLELNASSVRANVTVPGEGEGIPSSFTA